MNSIYPEQAICTPSNAGRVVDALILAYYFPPENVSGALRPARFARYLSGSGIRVSVISATDSHGEARIIRPGNGHAEIVGQTQGLGRVLAESLHRALPYNDQLQWVPNALSAAKRLCDKRSFSVVISTSPPLATHIAAMMLKRRYGLTWVADLRDPLVGNPFRPKMRGRLWDSMLERRVVTGADVIIANTDVARDTLQRRYPEAASRIHLIWNGYDPDVRLEPRPLPQRSYRVIAHFGSLYGGRHPGALIRSLNRLIDRRAISPSSVRVRLRGTVDLSAGWVADPAFRSLKNHTALEVLDQVLSHNEAQEEMLESDTLLLLDLNSSSSVLQVPAKVFEYVRIGRPILAYTPANSPADRILSQSGVSHVSIDPREGEQAQDEKVLRFLQLPTTPSSPSPWFNEQFDGLKQTQTLARLIHQSLTVSSMACSADGI